MLPPAFRAMLRAALSSRRSRPEAPRLLLTTLEPRITPFFGWFDPDQFEINLPPAAPTLPPPAPAPYVAPPSTVAVQTDFENVPIHPVDVLAPQGQAGPIAAEIQAAAQAGVLGVEVNETREPGDYRVKFYHPETAAPVWVNVHFDGVVRPEDLRPGSGNELWPLLYGRAFQQELPFPFTPSIPDIQKILQGFSLPQPYFNDGTRADAEWVRDRLEGGSTVTASSNKAEDNPTPVLDPQYGIVRNREYGVRGIELPPSGTDGIWVTLRNPLGHDNYWRVYDVDASGRLDLAEWFEYKEGLDGNDDGIVRVPWEVFSTHFGFLWSAGALGQRASVNEPQPAQGQVAFNNPNPGPFEVREGETLTVSLPATDPEGQFVLYGNVSGPGHIHPQTGVWSWLPTSNDLGLFSVTVKAATNAFDTGTVTFLVNVTSGRPRIQSLSASTNSVTDAGTDPLVLTANGVATDIGVIDRVEFYRDANGNGTLDPATDVRLAWDVDGSDGWSWDGQLTGVSPGNYSVFARAARYSFSDLFFSNVVSTVIEVTDAPEPEPVAIPVGGEVTTVTSGASLFTVAAMRDAAGNLYAVVNTSTGAFLRGHSPDGTPTSFVPLVSEYVSHAAMRPNGDFVIVWEDDEHVFAQRFNPGGTPAGSVIPVSVDPSDFTSFSEGSPRVAYDAAGGFLVTWCSGSISNEDLYYRRFGPSGAPLGDVRRFDFGFSGDTGPSVAMDAAGNAIIAWASGNYQSVMAMRVDPAGQTTATFYVSTPSGNFGGTGVQVAFTRDGGFVVAWAEDDAVFRRFAADHTPIDSAPVRLSPVDFSRVAGLAATPSGHFVALLQFSGRDPGDGEFDQGVYGQVIDPNGNLMGGNFRVPTTVTSSQYLGGLVADGGLDFFAVWDQLDPNVGPFGERTSTRFQRFTVDLPPTVSPTPTSAVGRQAKRTLAVPAVDPDGQPVTLTKINGTAVAVGGSVNLPSGARVTLNANGTLSYEPRNAVAIGSVDSFAYTVADGTKTSVGSMSFRIASDLTASPSRPSPTGAPAIAFTELPANVGAALQVTVKGVGPDGQLGTADDSTHSVTPTFDGLTMTVPGLAAGLYRVTVDDALADETGRLLDGNGDGTPGGDFVRDFFVNAAGVLLDPSFNGGTTAFSSAALSTSIDDGAMAVLPDGGVVVVSNNTNQSDGDFLLAKFRADGTPDPTFGVGGVVLTDLGLSRRDTAHAVAVQGDGKIVVVGSTDLANFREAFAVARYLPDGTLDTSFDGDGLLLVDFDTERDEYAEAVAIQPDGKIVIVGTADGEFTNTDFALLRLLLDGTLDSSFDGDGKLTTNFGVAEYDYARAVHVRPDGGLWVMGGDASTSDWAMARYLPNGSLDTTFDGDGRARLDRPNMEFGGAAFDAAGRAVVAGTSHTNPGGLAVARIRADGTLDPSFGVEGVARALDAQRQLDATAVTVLPDGSIVAAGEAFEPTTGYVFAAVRFDADGRRDTGFGQAGIATAPAGLGGEAWGVAVTPDGRLVLGGRAYEQDSYKLAAARLTFRGTLSLVGANGFGFDVDTAGAGAGQLVSDTNASFDALNALRVNGTDFAPALPANGSDDGDRTVLTGVQTIAGLGVRREVTVPAGDGVSFARTVDAFTNGSGAAINTSVRYVSNLGSDAATVVFATSDGDLVAEATDWWIATDDGDGTGSPAVVHVLGGPRGLKPTTLTLSGDSLTWTYDLTVSAGATDRLATFTIPATLRSQALAALNSLMSRTGFLGDAAAFLTPAEIASLENVVFLQAPTIAAPLADVNGTEDTAIPSIPLQPAFADVEDGSAGLTYTVVSVTGNFNLVSPSVDPDTGVLTLTPNLNANGSATVLVRATDSDGLFVEQSFDVTLASVPDAPLIDVGRVLMLPSVAKNATAPPAVPVTTLLRTASNPDGSSAAYGVAVTGFGGIAGRWEYTTSVGGLWSAMPAATPASAFLLPRTAFVRFVPDKGQAGHAGIEFKAWDGITGSPFGTADTTGATFAFSQPETAWTPVGVKSPTYDALGRALTKPLSEEGVGKPVKAKTLLGLLANEFPAKTPLGLAVVAVSGGGEWQVKVGKDWQPIADPAETAARLVAATGKLRFVPDVDWTGDATITYRAWVMPTGTLPTVGDVTADPADYSVETLSAVATVTPVNDAPTLDVSSPRVFQADPQAVSDLLAGSADVDGVAAGIAIVSTSADGGTWEYRTSDTSAWTPLPKVSTKSALLLGPAADLRFTPDNGATEAQAALAYKAVDNSLPFTAGQQAKAKGSAFSTATETATFSLGNAAPTFAEGDAPSLPTANGKPVVVAVSKLTGRIEDTPGSLKGIAVTATAGSGTWEFSLDRGKTWKSVGSLGTTRLLLRSTDRLRYTPSNGTPPSLTFAAWDQTVGAAGDRVTGADDSQSLELLTASA